VIGSLPLSAPELESRIIPALQTIEDRLMEVVTSADETINPPTSHLAEAGGKRLRPVLALLTAQLGDPALATGEEIRDAGVAVELTHIATLYHDDVMDEAPLRRGAPSAQTVWGNSAAILTGDVLVARASQLVAALGPEAVMAHAKTFERLCMGQLHETLPRPAGTDPVDHYIQVLADKTGSLIAVSARYGAMLTGAGTRTEQIAYYNLRSTAAVHSGDLTSAPDGAAEFIDVTLAEALRQGWRYVVMTVHSFSHHRLSEVPECWAGAMARGTDPQSGEVFEASTVMQRLDLVSPTFNATPFITDLAERRLIWWDLPVGVGEHQVANLDRSSNRVLAHLLDLLKGRRMPLAHLLGLLADDVVEDPDEAELVFGEGGILPWQTERILALLGPAEVAADAADTTSDMGGGTEGRQAE